MIHKNSDAYKSIGEVAKILGLVNKKKGTLNTHTIRFWEKEFKQIKPKILNGNRRYYNNDTAASFINPIYSSALFAHGVPSSRTRSVVPSSPRNFLRFSDFCSLAASHIIASGAPTTLVNSLTACMTSDLVFIGIACTKPLSVTNNWQQLFPQDDFPAFLVAKNVSIKK